MSIKIALAGNPNCGKTTLFNALTGSNQYVGNWPGVTVEKKEGKIKEHNASGVEAILMDLPGIYSLSPYTLEEVVSRNYLLEEMPNAIINIVDGTNLERNLYLTTQLIELGIPTIVAVNMMDLVRKKGEELNLKRLENEIGCKVVEISALKGEGIHELANQAIAIGKSGKLNAKAHSFSKSIEDSIMRIEEIIIGRVDEDLKRWYAIKLFERDKKVKDKLRLDKGVLDNIELIITRCEKEKDDDAESIITAERYDYITSIIEGCFKKRVSNHVSVSDKIDHIVTNRFLALPIFALIMVLVYYVSVTTIGSTVTDFTNDVLFGEWIQPAVTNILTSIHTANWVISLIVDGIIGGLAAPIGFAPQMAILFFFLSILEDCGYMARVAFIMDRAFRRFGLSGKSFIPLLISSGCGVPGIMSTRTIENEKDRRMTMITTTMIPCGAKLPVIALIAGAIMGGAWWMAPAMYFVGIAAVIISCIMLKKFKMFGGDTAPFVMELPQYHFPSIKGVLMHVWERVWNFLKKAGTVLFLCCSVMWFLATFGVENGSFGMVDKEHSLIAIIGGIIAPIFSPLGFGNWKAVASSLSGFVAKEGIVSTMAVLVGLGNATETDASLWTAVRGMFPSTIAAVSFLIFNLLDSPCLAAISTLSREMNSRKWTVFALVFQNVFSYCIALMVYQFGSILTGTGKFGIGTVIAIAVLATMLYLLFRPGRKARSVKASLNATV